MTGRELFEDKKCHVVDLAIPPCATHVDLENGPLSRLSIMGESVIAKGFVDHGGSRFPSSRDWEMPDVKCSRRTCVANYNSKCTMPSLIEIGSKGCKGYYKRTSGKKK